MVTWPVLLLALFAHQSFAFVLKASDCNINVIGENPQPVVVLSDSLEWLYPSSDSDSIVVAAGTTIEFACPKGKVNGVSGKVSSVQATCVSGSQFTINEKTVSINSLSCSYVENTARLTGNSCESDNAEGEIGYELEDGRFVRLIKLCFDVAQQTPLYSAYNLSGPAIGSHESGISRPEFSEDPDFFNNVGSVNSLYLRGNQRSTINGLLGLSSGSTQYIKDDDHFLSRGHLSAKADFIYANQQRGTFHYANAAPQWQSFNGVNWNTVEDQTRIFAESKELDLQVYTGTYGVATLPHAETGEEIELYLHVASGERGVPVPELYWKLIHNPATKEGVVIVGLNNPYQKDVNNSIICKDISKSVSFITWSDSIDAGYLYACDVNEFKSVVPYAPDLDVQSVLG